MVVWYDALAIGNTYGEKINYGKDEEIKIKKDKFGIKI